MDNSILNKVVGVVGLGYVGLPLAVEFGKLYTTIGFDINEGRIDDLKLFNDRTMEMNAEEIKVANKLVFTTDKQILRNANFFIITVPTPVDKYNSPDLTPLRKASETVASVLKVGDIVVYESTVYPSVTEEFCVPILENVSGLKFNQDFFAGYSPERINPGDKQHRLTTIRKITSGSTSSIAQVIDNMYASIIKAGTYLASSIKVAEAAKVIENAQRDINIAFINELAKIFNKLQIDTHEVLNAAGTKWNFLPFKPGLVGGHCIGIDPYYLAQKAIEVGYHPEIILAGRRVNDSMGVYVAQEFIKLLIDKSYAVKNTKVCILGITFKENCPDIRNSKVIDIINELRSFGVNVVVFDPWASAEEVLNEYNLPLEKTLSEDATGFIVAVAHSQFNEIDFGALKKQGKIIYDVKGILPAATSNGRL